MPDLPRWVVSDTHLGLEDAGYRPRDADALLVAGWRRRVGPDDVVWHLGDVALASDSYRRRNRDLLASLPGRVTLIPGNWDDARVIDMCRAIGWQIRLSGHAAGMAPAASQAAYVRVGEQVVTFSHFPEEPPLSEGLWNVHGHVHARRRHPTSQPRGTSMSPSRFHDWGPVELAPLLRSRGVRIDA